MSDKIQRVRDRAYQIWQQQGEPEGLHTEHWLQAEEEVGASESANEGEGNRTAARQYDEAATEFAHSGKVEPAADAAVKSLDDPVEAEKLKEAEKVGKGRSHGEDLAVAASN